MREMNTSVKKARKYVTHALKYFRPKEEVKEQLSKLRQALEQEYYWDKKQLSLVPFELEDQNAFNSQPHEPPRLTRAERKTLRRSLLRANQGYMSLAPILRVAPPFTKRDFGPGNSRAGKGQGT